MKYLSILALTVLPVYAGAASKQTIEACGALDSGQDYNGQDYIQFTPNAESAPEVAKLFKQPYSTYLTQAAGTYVGEDLYYVSFARKEICLEIQGITKGDQSIVLVLAVQNGGVVY